MHVPRILKPSYSSWMWCSGLLSLLFLFVFILRTSHWPPASLTDSALGFPRLWGNLTQAFFVTVFSFWHFPLFFKNPISLLCEPFALALFSPSSVRTPDVRLAVILAPVCSFHRPRTPERGFARALARGPGSLALRLPLVAAVGSRADARAGGSEGSAFRAGLRVGPAGSRAELRVRRWGCRGSRMPEGPPLPPARGLRRRGACRWVAPASRARPAAGRGLTAGTARRS